MARPQTISDEEILQTTRDCIAEFGPSVSIETIAKKLGVTGPSLLWRYGSKAKLLLAALGPSGENLLAKAVADIPATPGKEGLLRVCQAICAHFERVRPLVAALHLAPGDLGEADEKQRPPSATEEAEIVLITWLRRASTSGALQCAYPEVMARALVGALGHQFFEPGDDQTRIARRALLAERIVEMMWIGLAPGAIIDDAAVDRSRAM
jgi:AcrR family transcriptional regulator